MRGSVLLIALLATQLAPAPRPDFNGIWIGDDTKNAAAIKSGIVPARERISILHTPLNVVVTLRPVGSRGQDLPVPPNMETVCNFGETPAENLRPMLVESCLARWNDDALVMTLETKGAGSVPFRVTVITYAISDGQLKTTRTLTVNGALRSSVDLYYSRP